MEAGGWEKIRHCVWPVMAQIQSFETDFTKPAFDANPQVKKMIASQTALGRVGVPDDIGGVVAFLCSEDARWLNGQRLEASGGIFL